MEEELWKPLVYNGVSYDGYEVCNLGKIRSLNRCVEQKSANGNIYKRAIKGCVLKSFIASQYEHVKISVNGKRDIHILVHRAVAESFVYNSNIEMFTDVNHIDENKLNNRWDNLEWCTKSYNQKYYAENHPKERLKKFCKHDSEHTSQKRKTKRPTKEELKRLVRANSFLLVGKMFGVSNTAVRKWCKFYGVPFTQKDIKNCTDEEWDKI